MVGPISLEDYELLREIAAEPIVLEANGRPPADHPHPSQVARLLARQLVMYQSDEDAHRLVVTRQGRDMLGI